MSNVELIEGFGFKLDTWDDFRNTRYLPDGLIGRAEAAINDELAAGAEVTHVLYDPTEERKNLLILGNDPEVMAAELMAMEGMAAPVVPSGR